MLANKSLKIEGCVKTCGVYLGLWSIDHASRPGHLDMLFRLGLFPTGAQVIATNGIWSGLLLRPSKQTSFLCASDYIRHVTFIKPKSSMKVIRISGKYFFNFFFQFYLFSSVIRNYPYHKHAFLYFLFINLLHLKFILR